MSLEALENRHGVCIFPALRTQSELRRGRRHDPVPRMTQDAQGQWVRKDSLAPGEVYRYSQDAQGQWKRGLENLRTLALDSGMPLALIPEPRSKAHRDAEGTVRRARPSSFRKMVLNEDGNWEPAARPEPELRLDLKDGLAPDEPWDPIAHELIIKKVDEAIRSRA